MDGAEDLQTKVLRAYTVLSSLRPNWPGTLILNVGLNPTGAAVSLAANIAGAVCLTLEPDPTLLRNALRAGACDFIVNTLDEALRAMKNEVRKHLPLSVGLQGNPTLILQELLERGVSPQLFTDLTHNPDHLEAILRFKASGTLIVNFDTNRSVEEEEGILNADALIEAFVHPRRWHLDSFLFDTPAALRTFDTYAMSLIPEDDSLRRRWLLSAPRILHRERPIHRAFWVTEDDRELLQQKLNPTPHANSQKS